MLSFPTNGAYSAGACWWKARIMPTPGSPTISDTEKINRLQVLIAGALILRPAVALTVTVGSFT